MEKFERSPGNSEPSKEELFGDATLKRLVELSPAENEAEVLSLVSRLREELADVPKVGRTLETGREEFTIPITSSEQKERIVSALEDLGIFPWMENGLLFIDHRRDLDKLALAGIYESPHSIQAEVAVSTPSSADVSSLPFPLKSDETLSAKMKRLAHDKSKDTKVTKKKAPEEGEVDDLPELDAELADIVSRFDQGLIDEDAPEFRGAIGLMPSLRLFPRKYRWRGKNTFEEIRTGKILGEDDMKELYVRAHEGDARATDTVARVHTGLILSIAVRVKEKFGGDPDDLFQDGMLGLVQAIRGYKEEGSFVGYAAMTAEGRMRQKLQDFKRPIRLPSHRVTERGRLARAIEKVQLLTGKDDQQTLIARGAVPEFYEPPYRYARLRERLLLDAAFNPVEEIEDEMVTSSVQDEKNAQDLNRLGMHKEAADAELAHEVTAMLTKLTPQQERVLRLRYGIGTIGSPLDSDLRRTYDRKQNSGGPDEDGLTLAQIGKFLNLSGTRIQQIEARALRKLKHPSRSRALRELFRLIDEPRVPDDIETYRKQRSV